MDSPMASLPSLLSLNTHDYDGKINIDRSLLEEQVDEESLIKILNNLQELLSKWTGNLQIKIQAQASLSLLMSDKNNNYDPCENINVSQLLPRILKHLELTNDTVEDITFIWEQFGDITGSGPCSQGRVKRLLQIYLSLC
jgi:hypothetical protein